MLGIIADLMQSLNSKLALSDLGDANLVRADLMDWRGLVSGPIWAHRLA